MISIATNSTSLSRPKRLAIFIRRPKCRSYAKCEILRILTVLEPALRSICSRRLVRLRKICATVTGCFPHAWTVIFPLPPAGKGVG